MNRTKQAFLLLAAAVLACAAHARRGHDTAAPEIPGVRVERDIAYGSDPAQRLDVYVPEHPTGPMILMVHGGGWAHGDKASSDVVTAKARHWTAQGFVFISTNYRLLPAATPLQQADDVAHALARVERDAARWGADPGRVILMGHSAGAHLVALLDASPELALRAGAQLWRGTVSLDSAALDVASLMQQRHLPLYDHAFGTDPSVWHAASPLDQLTAAARPMLAVCSSKRRESCVHADGFARKAGTLGVATEVLREDMTHAEINHLLGEPGAYTDAVDRWIASVLPSR